MEKNGIVKGDKLQIDFSPFIHHSIFQSKYSRDTFIKQGFKGNHSIIHNGVDTSVFNQTENSFPFGLGKKKRRTFWNGKSIFRFVIVTWSRDPNKGFKEYLKFDEVLRKNNKIEIWFVGRKPADVRFRNIREFSPRGPVRLAHILKQCHGFIQMAQYETCSNAMLEAINCGLPVIYLDSGSAEEIALNYGIKYRGDPLEAIERLKINYPELTKRIKSNPYSINNSALKYINLIKTSLKK